MVCLGLAHRASKHQKLLENIFVLDAYPMLQTEQTSLPLQRLMLIRRQLLPGVTLHLQRRLGCPDRTLVKPCSGSWKFSFFILPKEVPSLVFWLDCFNFVN